MIKLLTKIDKGFRPDKMLSFAQTVGLIAVAILLMRLIPSFQTFRYYENIVTGQKVLAYFTILTHFLVLYSYICDKINEYYKTK